MKTQILTAEDIAIDQAAETHKSGLLSRFFAIVTRLRRASGDRRMRAELAELDSALLRDIGIADDEVHRIRAREPFTPRAWRD